VMATLASKKCRQKDKKDTGSKRQTLRKAGQKVSSTHLGEKDVSKDLKTDFIDDAHVRLSNVLFDIVVVTGTF
jgi:hypothetical protein